MAHGLPWAISAASLPFCLAAAPRSTRLRSAFGPSAVFIAGLRLLTVLRLPALWLLTKLRLPELLLVAILRLLTVLLRLLRLSVLRPLLLTVLRCAAVLRLLLTVLLRLLRLPVLRPLLLTVLRLAAVLRLLRTVLLRLLGLPVLRPLLLTELRLLLAVLRCRLAAIVVEGIPAIHIPLLPLIYRPHLRGRPDLASQWPLRDNPVRAPVVLVKIRVAVAHGRLNVLLLEGSPLEPLLMLEGKFLAIRSMANSARATVEGYAAATVDVVAIPVVVVIVGVADVARIDTPDGGVVFEVSVMPPATNKANAEVAEPVVDAAVVADVISPVTGVPVVKAAIPPPVAWGPQGANEGRRNPRARDPVVAVWSIGPVTRSPDHAWAGAHRLLINQQRRRSKSNADEH